MTSAGEAWVRELGPIAGWSAQLTAMSDAAASEIVGAVHAAWIEGELGVLDDASDVTETDRRIGAFLRSVRASARPTFVYRLARSEADVRRWCWAPEWYLMDQDEDLLLFGDEHVRPLLEEAAAGATKGDYARSIVAHDLRDRAHAALRARDEDSRAKCSTGFGGSAPISPRLRGGQQSGAPASLDAVLRQVEHTLAVARELGAHGLAAYLARLASYGIPHRVREDEVRQRVFDLRRCSADEHLEPAITRRDRTYRASMGTATEAGTLVVDLDTGAMRIE